MEYYRNYSLSSLKDINAFCKLLDIVAIVNDSVDESILGCRTINLANMVANKENALQVIDNLHVTKLVWVFPDRSKHIEYARGLYDIFEASGIEQDCYLTNDPKKVSVAF